MANTCYCKLIVEGSPEELKVFRDRVRSDELDYKGRRIAIDFGKHVPEPPGLEQDEVVQNRFPAWYHWRNEHWGTDRVCAWQPRGSFKSGKLEYRLWTAWAPPVPWMDAVAAAHPTLRFDLEFEIEMGWGDGLLRMASGKSLEATGAHALRPEHAPPDGPRAR